jgi:SAM-dependent methyltransferase
VGASAKLAVTERIVENALVLRSLAENARRILDFGGVESVLPLQLAALGKEVWVLDGRRYPFAHENLHAVQADVLRDPLPFTEGFDAVISVSTIEHVGLGRYGDTLDERGDHHAVELLWRLVRPGGQLLATVPAGRPANQRGYRVYNEDRLHAVFPSVSRVLWFMKDGRQGTWREVSVDAVHDLVYEQPFGEAATEGVAVIVAEKP